ncbi:hypothetical protein ACFSO9_03960 [Mesonia maritima]
MGKHARERVLENFTLAKFIGDYEEAYINVNEIGKKLKAAQTMINYE